MDLVPVVSDTNLDTPVTADVASFRVDPGADHAGAVLVLHGEADIATAPLFARALMRASGNGHDQVVLDAEGLEFVDAHCLGIIANVRLLLQRRGQSLVMRSPSPLVRRVLTIVDMQNLIDPAHR